MVIKLKRAVILCLRAGASILEATCKVPPDLTSLQLVLPTVKAGKSGVHLSVESNQKYNSDTTFRTANNRRKEFRI